MPTIRATATTTFRASSGQFVRGKITPAVRAAAQASGDFVLQEAQANVRVRSGELHDSGKVVIVETEKSVTALIVFTSEHAGYNEFGTGVRGASSAGAGPYPYRMDWPGMEAAPFMRPALDSGRSVIKEIFASQIALSLKT